MAQTPEELMQSAADAENMSAIAKQGIGGTLLAMATVLISGVLTAGDLFIKPMAAMGDAVARMVTAIFGEPAKILIAGADETARSLTAEWAFGPFTFALAIGSILLGMYILSSYLGEEETGNLLPGLPDVPIIGREEEDE